jgi:hypothetical protein
MLRHHKRRCSTAATLLHAGSAGSYETFLVALRGFLQSETASLDRQIAFVFADVHAERLDWQHHVAGRKPLNHTLDLAMLCISSICMGETSGTT